MIDQKHAKEPWTCNDYGHIYDSDKDRIAAFAQVYPECAVDIELEDAKRIVECVNACAGIENPLDLRRERDELREALNKLLEMYLRLASSGDAGFWDAEKEPEVILARSALTKTKESV